VVVNHFFLVFFLSSSNIILIRVEVENGGRKAKVSGCCLG